MNRLDNPALCPAPWRSLFIEATGRVDNCCVAKNQLGHIQQDSVQEIIFGEQNQAVQQSMLRGQLPEGCDACKNKKTSVMEHMWRMFPDTSPENFQSGDFNLQYLDARWSNTCNLACVYCTPAYSSTWAQELNMPVRIDKQYKNELLNHVLDNVKNLKNVYLAGGEPLLMRENEILIEAIQQQNPDCHVLVNTNLTQVKSSSIFQNLLQLKNCQWLISVDDSHERFEYLRYPALWSEFVENLEFLKSKIARNRLAYKLSFNMVVTSLNAVTIWDTVDWLLDQGLGSLTMQLINAGLTQVPLEVRSMPLDYQQKVLHRMDQEKYRKLFGWQDVYDHLKRSIYYDAPNCDVKSYLQRTDVRRGLDSTITFPMVYQYLQ